MSRSKLREIISIPDYWKDYVDANVDLRANPSQPCPFHNEKHGRSFSYSAIKNCFSCFGACHVLGGDVVRLHMLNYKIRTYEEAEKSLARLYNLDIKEEISFEKKAIKVDDKEVRFRVAYGQACGLAKNIDDWLRLDLIMSQYPVDVEKLEVFIESMKGTVE